MKAKGSGVDAGTTVAIRTFSVDRLQEELSAHVRQGSLAFVRFALGRGADPTVEDCILQACEEQHTAVALELLRWRGWGRLSGKTVDLSVNAGACLVHSVSSGGYVLTKALLEFKGPRAHRVNPLTILDGILWRACSEDGAQSPEQAANILQLLLKWAGEGGGYLDPTREDPDPLLTACTAGFEGAVDLLLGWRPPKTAVAEHRDRFLDPRENDCAALVAAAMWGHASCVARLLRWKRGEHALCRRVLDGVDWMCQPGVDYSGVLGVLATP